MKKIGYSHYEFPPCCGIKVLGSFAISGYDGLAWTDEEVKEAKAQFAESFYSPTVGYLICSTAGQPEVKSLLEKTGWTELDSFRNPNTGNRVCVLGLSRNY